ncbi:MAG: Holliday junction branch migration protein RuvA [Verrucomicrobiia bacterium]
MIAFLRGRLEALLPGRAVVEVGGVGYEVLVPMSTFERLPPPPAEGVKLLTYLQVREDAHLLYGFATSEERDLFALLLTHVSGVGPKLALAFLNGCSPARFREAVATSDLAALAAIKGVGKKTAERVIVELRDKVGVSEAWQQVSGAAGNSHVGGGDALLALMALGYKQADALKAIAAAGPRETVEETVREALKRM